MKLEDQVRQLTELTTVLVPVVDRLAVRQEKVERVFDKLASGQEKLESIISKMINSQEKNNQETFEMRLSNIRLTEAI